MKKNEMKYKILVTMVFLFIIILSLSFGFFVAKDRTNGNVAYWVFKIIAILLLVIQGTIVWVKNASFSKIFPNSIVALIAQFLPILMRIGWYGEDKNVPVGLIYFNAIILFIMIALSILYSISHSQFKQQEDKAKHSSNYQK